MVDLGEDNVRRFIEMIVGLGYRPRVPVQSFDFLDAAKRREWLETKSMMVFTWLNPTRPYEEIDVFLRNRIDFALAFSRKTSCRFRTSPFTSRVCRISLSSNASPGESRTVRILRPSDACLI